MGLGVVDESLESRSVTFAVGLVDLPSVVGVMLGAGVGTWIGQRRVVHKYMPPESAVRWFALRARERWRIRWAVAHGKTVGDDRLAPLAVAQARMRRTLAARMTGWRLVAFWVVFPAIAVAAVVGLHDGSGIPYAAVMLVALLWEAVARPSRAARLRRAEEVNRALASPAASGTR